MNNTHAAAPALLVRNVLADYWAEMLGVEVQQVNGRELANFSLFP
jgi:hypothetical protein